MTRRHSGESAQAIVLVALIMVVLFGCLGLAIDGGRAYLDRRELQAAVDAAALGAAYDYMNHTDYAQAEQAAADVYASNERLYTTPACSGFGTLSGTCDFDDSTAHRLSLSLANRSIAGVSFTATGTHRIPVTIMQVLGSGTSIPVSATATAVARRSGTGGAAVQTLSPAGCPSGGSSSLTVTGTSSTSVTGDIWSNGRINVNGSASASVAGNVVDICPPIPPTINGITLVCSDAARSAPPCPGGSSVGSEVNGWAQPDPGYAAPPLDSTNRTWAATTVVALPGNYASDPRLTGGAGCYFLSAGVYTWQAGFTVNGGFASNELRPPDEPVYNDKRSRAASQLWDANGVHCSGSFQPYPVGSDVDNPAVPAQAWAVEVTAVRWVPYGISSCNGPVSGSCFLRESAPSMCRLVDVSGSQVFKVWVSNVPGAAYYNVYADPTGTCTGPFGYVTQFANNASEGNQRVSNCAPTLARNAAPPNPFNNCDLAAASTTINGSVLPAGWSPDAAASPDTAGAYPPDGERAPLAAGLPNAPPTGTWPAGDRANENHCLNSLGGGTACPGTISAGAVAFFIPGGGSTSVCLNLQGGGDIYLFSGPQYARILMFEPGPQQAPPANTCPNNVNGHGLTSLLGIFYMPAADVTITGNSGYFATIAGGVVAWTASIKGNGAVSISADPTLRTWPSAVRLTN